MTPAPVAAVEKSRENENSSQPFWLVEQLMNLIQGSQKFTLIFVAMFFMLLTVQAILAFNRNSEMDVLIQSLQKTQAELESQVITLNTQIKQLQYQENSQFDRNNPMAPEISLKENLGV